MVQWIIGLILHGGPIELFLISASLTKAVECAILSVGYERTFAAYWKE